MPGVRKLRFCPRKYRKKKEDKNSQVVLNVSLPLDLVMVLPVTIQTNSLMISKLSLERTKEMLKLQAKNFPPGWAIVQSPPDKLVLTKTIFDDTCSQSQGISAFSLVINENYSWNVLLPQGSIPHDSSIFQMYPCRFDSVHAIESVVNKLNFSQLCTGNQDEKFKSLREWKNGCFLDKGKRVVAYVDHNLLEYHTVRHIDCHLFLPSLPSSSNKTTRCPSCSAYRPTLRVLDARLKRTDEAHTKSKMNDRWRSNAELRKKMSDMRRVNKATSEKLRRMTKKLEELIDNEGIELSSSTSSDLSKIVDEHAADVFSKFPEDSFPVLFWKQQMHAVSLQNSKNMRWHPFMIRWCIYLHHISGKGYELLRDRGILSLPSTRTLRDYTHYNETNIGFSTPTDKELFQLTNQYEPWQRNVAIAIDEMYIREGIVYNKHTGEILGFTDIGDITNHLLRLEHSMTSTGEPYQVLAKTMLVFMVRGLCTSLEFPYAQFACGNLKAVHMFRPITEAVFRLERLGLKVLAITADGASNNRKLFDLLSSSDTDNTDDTLIPYKVLNPYTYDKRYIFFISDPPHLLKTIRNCVFNTKRSLWNNGQSISWNHIEQLYRSDSGACSDAGSLCLVPKLKYEHVYLDSFSKMRVDLAAQVMSETVSKALNVVVGAEAKGTSEFILIVDRLFDCLNVTNLREAKLKRKPFRSPYRRATDWRLTWLEDTCLKYFSDWEKSVSELPNISPVMKKKMLLSRQTLDGIHMTVKSFVELVKVIFDTEGIKFFLSEKICQDPLEKFFGNQRQRGRTNENPNVMNFCKNTQALKVVGGFCRDKVKGNCKTKRTGVLLVDETPLSKRKKKH